MNSRFLADQAFRQAKKAGAYLSTDVIRRLALAHVAEWISQQDAATDPAKVLQTARGAIDFISQHPL